MAVRRIRHASPEDESPVFGTNSGQAEPVGRFNYAVPLRSRPQVLTTWRISSDDPSVLDRVAEQLGGTPQQLDGNTWSLTTHAAEVGILLDGPRAVRLRWSRAARHSCDGHIQRDDSARRPCTCPPSIPDRRMATRRGQGCEPKVDVVFRLRQDPALGSFRFTSGSWPLAEDAIRAVEALRTYREPGLAGLRLHRAPYTLASGKVIDYTTPTLTLLPRVSSPHRPGPRERARRLSGLPSDS